ncbi:patched domain-containing protein 3-like [Branchiostoma floridae x Branchiostoma japonicum]
MDEEEATGECSDAQACLSSCNSFIEEAMESFFYRLGSFVGSRPWTTIIIVGILGAACGIGMAQLEVDSDQSIFVPLGSAVLKNKEWVKKAFPSNFVFENVLVEAENVLTPEVLQSMLKLDNRIRNISTGSADWESLCFILDESCYTVSLLELWSFNTSLIHALTQTDILDMINTENLTSPMTDRDFKVTDNLGGVLRDEEGRITQAGAATMMYAAQTGDGEDRENELKEVRKAWEIKFVDAVNEESSNSGSNITYFPATSSSYSEGNNIAGDVPLLMAGCVLILVYVVCQLGQFNRLQHKVYLSLIGVICIGLAVVGGIGICLLLGLRYNVMHSMLPFLVMGIGVDDMFVIVTTWNNLSPEQKTLDVRQQAALTLRHAGMSITVTSLTDIASFGIGAITIIPGLQSFCVFVTVSIFFVFIYLCTIFMAALVLDLRRAKDRRDACCCCLRLGTEYEPSACSEQNFLQLFFQNMYSPVLMKTPVKILVAVSTVCLVSVSIVGTINLEQEFDYVKQMTDYDSDIAKYSRKVEEYYPGDGQSIDFYIGEIDYYHERHKLKDLYDILHTTPFLKEGSVTSWYHDFGIWINDNKNQSLLEPDGYPEDPFDFYLWLIEYLATDGKHHFMNISFRPSSNHSLMQ